MAANKRKILEAARKHAQKGAKEKALKEYTKLLKLEPRDSKLRLEIGDAHRRWGQVDEAIEAYSKVAEHFMNEGFDARAVAVFKQIQNLDAESFSFHEPLAELYQRMGLTAEAIGCLESAADGYYRAGQKQEALGLLRKMATIDPSNTTSRIKVADLLHQEGMTEEAIAEYDEVIVELELGSDTETLDKVFERILEIEPDRVATLHGFARTLVDRALPERAESMAARALELEKTPENYELLADVYRLEKRDEDLVKLYRELAELYRERGDEERTREILQRYVPLDTIETPDPSNGYIEPDELESGDPLLGDLGVGDDTTLLDEDLLSDESLLVSDGDSGFGILTAEGDSGPLGSEGPTEGSRANELTCIMPEGGLAPGADGVSAESVQPVDADQLLAEASVYLRYGKRDQAIANLEIILERQPDHRSALEKLGDAAAEGDDSARAVELWSRAARLAAEDGNSDQAEILRNRIAALDPAAAEGLDLTVPDGPDPAAESAPTPEDLIAPSGAEAAISEGDFELPPDSAAESPEESAAPDLDLPEIDLDDIEIDVDAASFHESASSDPPPMLLEEQPPADSADSEEVDIDAETGAGAGASGSVQFTEDLEEADFYLQQGLLDEAEAVYTRILSIAPNHPHALVRLGELAAQRGQDPSATAAPVGLAEAMAADEAASGEAPSVGDIGEDLAGIDDAPSADTPAASEEVETPEPSIDVEIGADLAAEFDAIPSGDESEEDVDVNADTLGDATGASAEPTVEPTVQESAAEAVDEPTTPEEQPSPFATTSVDLDDFEIEDEPEDDEELSFVDDPPAAGTPEVAAASELAVEPQVEEVPDVDEIAAIDEPPAVAEAPSLDPTPTPAADEGDAGFDLGAELSQALDGDPGSTASGASASGQRADTSDDGFASVFAEFKKGVSETLSEGDHQARYDLGIAYREMGLLGDALTELQVAMNDPAHRIGSLQLMALCSLDLGEPEQATGYLREALSTPDLSAECELSLQLDLGKACEASGDIDAARTAYQEVQSREPGFADVEARLAELEKRASEPTEAASEDDDLDSADGPTTAEYETFDGFLDDLDDDEEDDLQAAGETDGGAAEQKSWESFDDVIAEAQSEDDEAADTAAEPVVVGAEVAESQQIDTDTADALEPDANQAADPQPEQPASRRRNKKISFV